MDNLSALLVFGHYMRYEMFSMTVTRDLNYHSCMQARCYQRLVNFYLWNCYFTDNFVTLFMSWLHDLTFILLLYYEIYWGRQYIISLNIFG